MCKEIGGPKGICCRDEESISGIFVLVDEDCYSHSNISGGDLLVAGISFWCEYILNRFLYDSEYKEMLMSKIKVTVERIDGHCNLPMLVGDHFWLEGSKLFIPKGKYICMWALQSMMPIFPILGEKENLNKSHWVSKVKRFSCPDPKGKVLYRLEVVEHDKD